MELGEKLKQARLEAGLSQRQLCGDVITRNMLSQIENGAAKPSMATLAYLSRQLGKSISFFLEEEAVTSPNQALMEDARAAFREENWAELEKLLENYRQPDPVFQEEFRLLSVLLTLSQSEAAIAQGKLPYARRLLTDLGPITQGYCAGELERRRLLLLCRAQCRDLNSLVAQLSPLDEELRIRAGEALERGDLTRCVRLLEAAENREDPSWNLLRGEVYFAEKDFAGAAECFRKGEHLDPERVLSRLEVCFRELGDYQQAYRFACAVRDIRK